MGNRKMKIAKTIKENVYLITKSKSDLNEIKINLKRYGISGGRIERLITNPDTIEDIDIREALLILEQFYIKSNHKELNPRNWFQEAEIKKARQYHTSLTEEEMIELPIVLEDVTRLSNNVFVTKISVKEIARMMKSGLINYNYDYQRQSKRIRRGDSIILRPTVYKENVKEIRDLLLNGRLVVSTVVLNAAMGTSDVGEELVYNPKNRTVEITKGTVIDILDGFHRFLACQEVYTANPDLDFHFILELSNYTTLEAQQHQAQHAKATPIPKTRVLELEASRHADTVVQQLRNDSELKDRIPSTYEVSRQKGDLVSYYVLSNAIDREFDINTRLEARKVADYLREYFDYLIGENQEEFVNSNSIEDSLMSYNKMFSGYIALASKMMENGISPHEVNSIIKQIDFSRNNPLWQELDVLNSDLKISRKLREETIGDYFKNLI